MFLLNLPVDVKEQAAIERRRREEKERLSRIFNDKYRTIGVRFTRTVCDLAGECKRFRSIRQVSKSKFKNGNGSKN